MKKTVLVSIIALFVLFGSISMAPAQEAAIKIGVVDLYKALNESEQGKKAYVDLESMIKGKKEALEAKGRAIEKLRSELEKQGDALSADAKKNKAEEYERLTREYQRNASDSENELRKKQGELTGRIIKQIRDIIMAMAKEEKYTLILERADGLVLFVDGSIDLTDRVIGQLDASTTSKPKKKK